jgi:hypothetical protein
LACCSIDAFGEAQDHSNLPSFDPLCFFCSFSFYIGGWLCALVVKNSFATIWIGGDTMGRHRPRKLGRVTTILTRTARACTSMLTCRKRDSWEMRPSFRALDSRPRQSTTAIRPHLTSIRVRYSPAKKTRRFVGRN